MRPTTGRYRPLLPLLVVAALAGCGVEGGGQPGGATAASGVTVRDSAGIRIVESHDSAWTEATRWRLADQPDLRLGSIDGSVPGTDWGEFIQVRSVGERLVVFDGMSVAVRVFGGDGVHERTIELRGEGPGEVRMLGGYGSFGADTIGVWGMLDRRVVRIDAASGDRASTSTPARGWEDTQGLILTGWLADGSWVMVDVPSFMGMEVGRRVLDARVFRFTADGEFAGDVVELPIMEAWKEAEMVASPVAFSPNGQFVTQGMNLWHAFPDSGFELTRVDPVAGVVTDVVRIESAREPVPDVLIEGMRAQQRAVAEAMFGDGSGAPPEMRRAADRMMNGVQFADSLPPFMTFAVGTDGVVWAQQPNVEQMEEMAGVTDLELLAQLQGRPASHVVIDPDGRWLGTVVTPAGFQAQEFGPDHVLGVRTDDLGVPWVERYRILKP